MFKRGYFAECLRLFCGVLAAIRRVLADILRRIKGVLPATKARSLSNVVKQINTLLEAASAAQEQATVETTANQDGDYKYSLKETDPATLKRLNSGETIKAYRAMQVIDGKLYPPMSARVDGKLREPIELGVWEKAEERPDLADDKGYFKLDKGNNSSLKARYNPYIHTSLTPLNDQFSSAQDRPNLVTVEVEVPASELTSGYKADKAKDTVGKVEWKAGVVQSQLSGTRTVILSRWDRPLRIIPDSEVAQRIVEMFGDSKIAMPSNVVTPSLRAELEKLGVPFKETTNQGKEIKKRGVTKHNTSEQLGQPTTVNGNPPVANLGTKLNKNYETAITDIENLIKEKGALSAHEFLHELNNALIGFNESSTDGSYYIDIGDGFTIRVSDHYSNANTFKRFNNTEKNYGIVIKLKTIRFKSDPNVNYVEFVYFPDKLDSNRQLSILDGVKGMVKTKDIGKLPTPDNTHTSGKTLYSLITPQMDADYLSAVERGDMATAQRMVLEAAKLAMPDTKIVDENGFPKVVYHQTNATEYVNVETGERWDDLDWMKRAEWDERDDWDEYWQEREFYTFSRANARTTQEFDGFFFAPEYDEYHEYGDRTISAFLNIKNPASRTDYNIDSSKNNAGREERLRLQQEGYDGVIREEDGIVWEYVAFEPNQIKSADPVTYDDNGNVIPLSERFNPEKEDIRYSLGQPTDEDVTFDNFFERTSAIFTQITDTPTTKPNYISRTGSTYWYGEDERGKYVIRRSDHWSAIVRDEEDAEAFNAKPDDFNNIASCYWALDMRTYKPQSFAPINKETVRSINYNSGSKDLNIVFNDGKTTRRRGVEPRDMRKYFELRNSGDMPAANGYVVDMVNELYSAAPMPTVQTAKAYLDEFTKWSGESEQKSEQKSELYSLQNQSIFYSNAEYAVRGIKQEKATPEQWLKMIEKSGGLKAGEDKWLGLSDWLKASDKKTLTKDEVLQYIAENDIQIEEVEYGDVEDSVRFKELYIEYNALYYEYGRNSERAFEVMLDNYGDDFGIAFEAAGDELWVRDSEAAEVFVDINSVNDTRLQYTTDGLTNKKEIALVVPTIEPWNTSDNIHFGDAGGGRAVAWIRFGETTDAEDNRVLVIDEIQSKRHQDGREKGYISVEEKATIDAIRAKKEELSNKRRDWDYRTGEAWRQFQAGDITEQEYNRLWDTQFDAERKQLDEIERGINSEVNVYDSFTKIPSAPFEKNWAELAMKRMLRYAAENGFDKVAWTTGEQQSERYNLSKIVDYIDAERNADGTYNMNVATNDDSHYVQENNISEKRLSELVGKDIAYGIISSIENSDDNKAHIEADDMTIGGAGMKAFYDQMLPSFVRKYAKKWGATVGEVTMPDLEENSTMHSVDVTPAMRESVMQGQPKFSLREVNNRFNEELQMQIDGTLPKGHIYKLGMPSDALRFAGIENLPIELSANNLQLKASDSYKSAHSFELRDVKDLVFAIQIPIAIFDSEEQNGKKVVLTELKDKRGINFIGLLVKIST